MNKNVVQVLKSPPHELLALVANLIGLWNATLLALHNLHHSMTGKPIKIVRSEYKDTKGLIKLLDEIELANSGQEQKAVFDSVKAAMKEMRKPLLQSIGFRNCLAHGFWVLTDDCSKRLAYADLAGQWDAKTAKRYKLEKNSRSWMPGLKNLEAAYLKETKLSWWSLFDKICLAMDEVNSVRAPSMHLPI